MKKAHLIANSKSGVGGGSTLAEKAQDLCRELGYELVLYSINDPKDFEKQSKNAVNAAKADGGVVIAAGGDGTIRGVAQAAHGTGVRFAAVPCGTFNFFARTHRIPEEPLEAFRLALTGNTKPVRLGRVNDQVFLINASLGLYAKAIREREHRTAIYGRNRIVVIISTIVSLLSKHFLLKVDLVTSGKTQTLRTPMIFIGNNALQIRDLAMDVARCMKADLLAVVMMKPVTKLDCLRIILRGIFKILSNEKKLESFCVDELTIHTHKDRNMVALDGEVFHLTSPLKIQALPGALKLVTPEAHP